MGLLDGKVVVVTGAGRGIGAAIALELTRRGHIVAGTSRNGETAVGPGHALEVTDDAAIVAIRLWMLVGTSADDQGWSDTDSYPTPDADLGDLVAGTDDYPSSARRMQISKTIYLNNQGS